MKTIRRILLTALWIWFFWMLLSHPGVAQTKTTVTGVVQDASGNLATSGTVVFTLSPQNNGVVYFVTGTGIIAPQTGTCGIDGTGNIKNLALSGACQVWGTDVIQPANLTYQVSLFPNGNFSNAIPQQCITGTTYDLSNPSFCPVIRPTPQGATVITTPIQNNLIPASNGFFSLGSNSLRYAQGFINTLTVNTILGNDVFQNGFTATGNVKLCSSCTLQFGDVPDTGISRNIFTSGVFMFGRGGFNDDLGIIDAGGYRIAGAALAGRVLRGDGTNFTSAQLAAADLSNGVSGTGAVCLTTNCVLTTPNIDDATATSVKSGVNPAATGILRVPNNTPAITARTQANTGDFGLIKLGTDNLTHLIGGGADFTVPLATDTAVGKTTTDILTNKTLNGALNGNTVSIFCSSPHAAALTGNSTDQTYATCTVPANTVGINKGFEVRAYLKHSTGTASITYKASFGGTNLFSQASVSHAGGLMVNVECRNNAATNAQDCVVWYDDGDTAQTFTSSTPAIDTTTNQNVVFTFNVANTDQITLNFMRGGLIQ